MCRQVKGLMWVIAPLISIMGCEGPSYYSDPVKESEIAGVYYANFSVEENDCIELRADGTYIHSYKSPDGHVYLDTGAWEFIEYRERSYAIDLQALIRRHPQKDGCYYTGSLAAIDTRPVDGRFPFYKSGRAYVITYCFGQGQAYVRKGRD